MKNLTENTNEQVSNQFKNETLAFLTKQGILIPVTNEEVELFEKIYGSTDFDLPDELKNPDSILRWGTNFYKHTSSPSSMSTITAMAARGGKNISVQTIKKMEKLHENAIKVAKKKK